jgi:hypothetical protein
MSDLFGDGIIGTSDAYSFFIYLLLYSYVDAT